MKDISMQELKNTATQMRMKVIDMIYKAQSGHPGGSLSAADFVTACYFKYMNLDPKNPRWEDRDRMVLSKGHVCPIQYACLATVGFFPESVLDTLRKEGSMLQGHPSMNRCPGIDISTGSLGQGLACAAGMALAGKLDHKDYKVFCVVGDGEAQEGEIWEAANTAHKYGLDNLIVFVDNNNLQLDGTCGAIGSKVLLTRVVSDTPLPEGEGNEEMRDAVLQNSLREYDLYDPATNTIEKVFDEPYYPEEHNELRSYLGYCGDKLYFGVTYTDSAAAFSTRNTLVSYDRTAGTWQEECSADSKGGEYSNFWPLLQDGQLRLVVLWRGTDTLTLYSIDNGARYEVPYEEAGSDATGNRNFPIALTDDGRILVTDGYIDRSGVAASRYALIDFGAYLAGSREYTAVEMWTE